MYYFEQDQERITKVFLYLRQSTEEKTGNQVRSIKDQRADCLLLAEKYGLEIIEEFRDEETAHEPNKRPNFDKMLGELHTKNPKKRRADGILAWHPDRLSRNALEAGKVIQMVDDEYIKDMFFVAYMFHNDSSGKEHLFMEFARAKGYSDKLSDVVLRGHISRDSEGAWTSGKCPYGHKKLREHKNPKRCSLYPIPKEPEFSLLKRAFQLRLKSKEYPEIKKKLQSEGYTKIPSKQRLSEYFSESFFYGLRIVNKGKENQREYDYRVITPPAGTTFIPVITEEEFWEIQRINKKNPKANKTKHQHIFSGGYVKCAYCDNSMYPANKKVKKKEGIIETQLGFECQKCKKNKRIKAEVIFNFIEYDLLGGLGIEQKEYRMFMMGSQSFLADKKVQRKNKRISISKQRKNAEKELEQIEEDRIALARSESLDDKAKKHLEKRRKKVQEELDDYTDTLKELEKDFDDTLFTFESFLELSTNAHRYWRSANDDQKKRIAKILVLNLIAKGGEMQSITYKKPFDKWLKSRKSAVVHERGLEPPREKKSH